MEQEQEVATVSLELIPGLPDDLALRCLAKISHGFHGRLEAVSKRWREVFRSSEYSSFKASEGWCGNWLFVLTEADNNEWIAYDPEANWWHSLPRIPRPKHQWNHFGFACVCVSQKFLVIGGYYAPCNLQFQQGPNQRHVVTNDVLQFDPFKKQWSRVASMHSPRSHFACSVVNGKVYVAGGRTLSNAEGLSLAEVYDPQKDRWEELPSMPMPQMDCMGLTYRGGFLVLGELFGAPDIPASVIYDPLDKTWCKGEDIRRSSKAMQLAIAIVPNDRFYIVLDSGESSIKTRETDESEWHVVGSVPPVVLPDHIRPLEAFGYGFAVLGQDLYVVGGKVLKWEEFGAGRFDIVKLKTVKACNSSDVPLKWREIKPMCRSARGAVIGCATMEE
ncbi:hypothetical protein Syun_022776 [Stephania yunnanensis]|uniref:F-box domain-containing protein n=1 Tax=Stephania yunnanensis TaxID=152371 RepID=A0AAP0F7M0_9MAGN